MKYHPLKTWKSFYNDILEGKKTFELRKDDRDFSVGDILELYEYNPETSKYTGNKIVKKVTYLIKNAPDFGLKDGFIIMGIEDIELL